jgi:membrane-associated phospholipid phosphatase
MTSILLSAAVGVLVTSLAWVAVVATRPAAARLRAGTRLGRRVSAGVSASRVWLGDRVAAWLLVLAAGAAAVFVLSGLMAEVTEAVVERDDLTVVDQPVLAWMAARRSPHLTDAQIGVTNLGSAIALTAMLLAMVGFVALRRRSWRPVVVVLAGAGGIQLLIFAIKLFIGRDRPDRAGRLVDASGFSFPSGHTAGSLVCFGLMAWLVCMVTANRTARATAWVAATLLTVAVGLSRVYLGVHFPSDVIGGWILGGAWLTVVAVGAHTSSHFAKFK